ncbi:amino acid permease [Lactobacillus sp. ESL0684]|uniref:APC family permease n=1 Tax=unclassified Lactobacillus TaxID=2620435 RepID=UPI0023F9BCA8|nr:MULTISPECIES: amino acid permease [unclassified Lactobacillus]WEV40451.1 amino acid permease [Lactobacillus sp. ESL0681]WEV43099.1 amino acid permease [Lactobacillus sp. ESL0684]
MIESQQKSKKMMWTTLAMMSFSTVWSFGNVVNGFVYFDGTKVIFSWLIVFLLFFVPYALMVGELGSVFKDSEGGVSSWVNATMGPKWAYYTGWTFWAVRVVYISSKGTTGLRGMSWGIFGNTTWYDSLPTAWTQLATLAVFLFFCWLASRGVSVIKTFSTIAGAAMFAMSILFIIMMFAAPLINPHANYLNISWNWKNFLPTFNVKYFSSLSILIFAVGGAENISPYVNKLKNPSSNFPKAMISLAIMVMVSAILGTIAMAMMFDPKVVNAHLNEYISNGPYMAFDKLGKYYGVGGLFMYIYAWCNVIGQFSTLVISIDAPLRMLLGSKEAKDYIPKKLLKLNKHGAYINGIWLIVALSGGLILVQALMPDAQAIMAQLIKLNSIIMPMRYLWIFVAYIALRKQAKKFKTNESYQMTKHQGLAYTAGVWCFIVTAACCLLGVYSNDPATLALNIATPVVLFLLGMILPTIRKHQK